MKLLLAIILTLAVLSAAEEEKAQKKTRGLGTIFSGIKNAVVGSASAAGARAMGAGGLGQGAAAAAGEALVNGGRGGAFGALCTTAAVSFATNQGADTTKQGLLSAFCEWMGERLSSNQQQVFQNGQGGGLFDKIKNGFSSMIGRGPTNQFQQFQSGPMGSFQSSSVPMGSFQSSSSSSSYGPNGVQSMQSFTGPNGQTTTLVNGVPVQVPSNGLVTIF